MSASFHELLDAAIGHLQALKARGSSFVNLDAETVRALGAPVAVARPVATRSAPAPNAVIRSAEPLANMVPASAPVIAPVPAAHGHTNKAQALAQLRERATECTKCAHLAATRTQIVFGVGNIDAELMFVGEAPGADEDAQGEPFVGAAGQLLTKMIVAMGLRREDVYIANILKCRPHMPPGSPGNRKPTPEEMQTCVPFLHAQIDIIQPKVLVALGGTAIEGLLGLSGISKLRGQWQTYRGTPMMPTYHPAFLLHSKANPMLEKRKVWEDLLAVMEKLARPISEKQRGYFLKA